MTESGPSCRLNSLQAIVDSSAIVASTMSIYSKSATTCSSSLRIETVCVGRVARWRSRSEWQSARARNASLRVTRSYEAIQREQLCQELEATFESDIILIKNDALRIFNSEEEFNKVVSELCAMQNLFITPQKSKEYPALLPPRELRAEWAARIPLTDPRMQPRDKSEDWSVLAGNVSATTGPAC